MGPDAAAGSAEKQSPTSSNLAPLTPPFSKQVEFCPPAQEHLNILHKSGPPESVQITTGAEDPELFGASSKGWNTKENLRPGAVRSSPAPRPPIEVDTTGRSPASPTSPSHATDILEFLPVVYYDQKKQVQQTRNGVKEYLAIDLDTSRLNAIHSILWMAGRPLNARPLHRLVMLDMRILRTEQADMHILRVSDRLFVKPLPPYLLSHDFWLKYLCGDPSEVGSEADRALHKRACGLLLSYVWLVRSELDFKIAREEHLMHKDITWQWWRTFVHDLLGPDHLNINSLEQVDQRYEYGELRLSRINTIYRIRFFHTHFIRGYLYGYNRYVVFFQRNFGWMLVIFVYFSLVLSAMQVGVSVPPLQENVAFQKASYGFVVFSIVLVAAIVGVVGVLFISIFTINTFLSVRQSFRTRRKRRQRWKAERQGVKQA